MSCRWAQQHFSLLLPSASYTASALGHQCAFLVYLEDIFLSSKHHLLLPLPSSHSLKKVTKCKNPTSVDNCDIEGLIQGEEKIKGYIEENNHSPNQEGICLTLHVQGPKEHQKLWIPSMLISNTGPVQTDLQRASLLPPETQPVPLRQEWICSSIPSAAICDPTGRGLKLVKWLELKSKRAGLHQKWQGVAISG